jgi:type IV pilus assembly protein PilW
MKFVHRKSGASRHSGLSLIELMVSILLGVILSSGIIAVYLESKRNYVAEEELARIQENGRFSLDLLKRELSMAGFFGGYLLADGIPAVTVGTDCSTDWALEFAPPVELVNDWTSGAFLTGEGTTLDCGLANVKSGTDVITIKRSAARATVYEGAVVNGAQLDPNEWYLKIEGYGENMEWYNNSSFAAFDPNDAVEYWEMYTKIFYIRDYSTTVGDDIPTLCVKFLAADGMTSDQCLVEGIEDMQIEFGVDTNGDNVPNTYTPDPNDMSVAVTARLYLLVRSLGELVGAENANSKTYQLGLDSGTVTTAADGYLRRIFSTTVLVRNAILPST